MLDRFLKIALDYLSCFAVVLREIHGNADICQTDYKIHLKLEFFRYSEIINEQHLRQRNTNSYVVKSEDQTDEKSVRTQEGIKLENCQLCNKYYDLDEWKAFNGMVVAERSNYLVKQKLCYGCYESISAKHTTCNCPKKRARLFYFIFILLR